MNKRTLYFGILTSVCLFSLRPVQANDLYEFIIPNISDDITITKLLPSLDDETLKILGMCSTSAFKYTELELDRRLPVQTIYYDPVSWYDQYKRGALIEEIEEEESPRMTSLRIAPPKRDLLPSPHDAGGGVQSLRAQLLKAMYDNILVHNSRMNSH